MRTSGPHVVLSATDLSHFLGCRHRTALDLAVAHGARARVHRPEDPLLDILIQRGKEHEANYVRQLARDGRRVVDLNALGIGNREESMARTIAAMRDGADVIVQAALSDGQWFGYADILQRVDTPSRLGAWSYEVADTKLARETRGGTILQLGLYSELVADLQGARPVHFYVVTPDPVAPIQRYRVDDYAAYSRLVRRQLLDGIALGAEALAAAHYPEPVEHCGMCHWHRHCRSRRLADDHLSLIAGVTRVQRDELAAHGLGTLTAVAALDALPFRPTRGSIESYARVIAQAEAQHASRGRDVPAHRLRAPEIGQGLGRLPEPSPGDLFLDLEGDPHAVEGGREYLFGLVSIASDGTPRYEAYWGLNAHEERDAFEAVIDRIMRQWAAVPDMHVYHYAPYEPAAFKRLMGRYATRAGELDALLRAARFVDLYAAVKQGLHVGVERYSIKHLEPAYGYVREVDLMDANRALRAMEQHLQLGVGHQAPPEVCAAVEGYNRDDCVSTWRLREWLEAVRKEAIAGGADLRRPEPLVEEPDSPDEKAIQVEALRQRLLADIPEEPASRTEEQQARRILAYLLDWHRREDKATWWEYFRLRDLPDNELLDEPQAIAGLEFIEHVGFKLGKTGKPTRTVIDRYAWPPQEMEIRAGGTLKLKEGEWGTVADVDRVRRTIDVEVGPSKADLRPVSAFEHTWVNPAVLEDALLAVGERVATSGRVDLAGLGAAGALLLRLPPRLRERGSSRATFDGASADVGFAQRVVLELDCGTLAVQGPPGAGKTYAGARMICALIKAGKRVGVTANSHKAIRNLLDAVRDAAVEMRLDVRLAHKVSERDVSEHPTEIREVVGNKEAAALLDEGAVDVLGATSWFWARGDVGHSVDVMFVDEAGQMALANTVAICQATASLVLLGDPQQLDQPTKGSHPDGVGSSALRHLLAGRSVISPEMGIFLPVTWRLAPSVCAFTSEMYYEGQLRSKDGLEKQVLSGCGAFDGTGLRVVEVQHEGNRGYADAEVDVVEQLVRQLTAPGAMWTDAEGVSAQLTGADILVVAAYNAQVARLVERLAPVGVAAGTVDKFQGQEAPVVIYTMAASSAADAPRGLEFLYSRNRLNVATSRARCLAILVANPRLFEPECSTPRQMLLANGVCRFRELSVPLR